MEHFKSKQWAITGRLKHISRNAATKKLVDRGASVIGSVTSKTDFLVSAQYDPSESTRLSNKETKAREYGIPIYNEAQLLAILSGGALEDIEELAPEVDESEVATRDALEGFRALLYEAANENNWAAICALVDKCGEADLPLVLDYIQANHPEPAALLSWKIESEHTPDLLTIHEVRELPESWVHEVLRGQDHPKLGLIRSAALSDRGLNGKLGEKLLSCTHLGGVQALSLGFNKLPMKFWEKLAAAPQFGGLRWLDMVSTNINKKAAEAFASAPFVETLTHLDVSQTNFKGGFAEFFKAGMWPSLKYLRMEGSSTRTDPHEVLANATHIDKLELLIWKNLHGSDEGFNRMVRAPHLSSLKALVIDGPGRLNSHMMRSLASASNLSGLEHLSMFFYSAPRDDTGLEEVFRAPQFSNLQSLHVSLSSRSLEVLLEARHIELKHLSVYVDETHHEGWEALLSANHLDGLETLKVTGYIPSGFLGRLLSSERLPVLKRFECASVCTTLNDDDVMGLARATHRGSLSHFHAHTASDLKVETIRAALEASHVPPYGLRYNLEWLLKSHN